MPKFVQLTMVSASRNTVFHVNIDHIRAVWPKTVKHPDDDTKPYSQSRYIDDGSYVCYGDGEDSAVAVKEDVETVMRAIHFTSLEAPST